MTGSEIRRKFLDYFVQHGHKEIHSSPLIPQNDPTLLFTNAGMNQFKDVFLGLEKRDYNRATTSQKCVRAGGKHNDLENVGFTNRHHTFFEMLGNFSFGDYFKKDAIAYAWELITSPAWFALPKEKLYVTIFNGEGGVPRDAEAYDLWAAQGVPEKRIYGFGQKDNFWQMGDTGPCGPCSEIHYDMGIEASDKAKPECAAGKCEFGCECGRYVEIWNLVFMQFDRDSSGKLNPLPKPSIDTGAGLERMACVLQDVISNYDTDLFTPLIKRAAGLTGASLKQELEKEAHAKSAASLRVIVDHSRAATFLISDGVIPSNEGRGYVLRKIIRRAITHGRLLGQTKPFFYQMVFAVRDLMEDAYPELKDSAERVSKVVQAEETRFAHTMEVGLGRLKDLIDQVRTKFGKDAVAQTVTEKGLDPRLNNFDDSWYRLLAEGRGDVLFSQALAAIASPSGFEGFVQGVRQRVSGGATVPGEDAFKLYDTYGLPRDFIEDASRDAGLSFDNEGFDRAMQAQRERARASWKGAAKQTASAELRRLPPTIFEGYQQTTSRDCVVGAIFRVDAPLTREIRADETAEVILDHTPFYADSGGQVGDVGWLFDSDGNIVLAEVLGCYMPVQGVRFHKVRARQNLQVGDIVTAVVNTAIRESTMRNHTATHLLHAGLREVLGKHVKQAGSLVDPAHLRFDFSHFTAVEDEELQDIEDLINKEVLRNRKVEVIENVPIDVAINEYKAMALFGEKYGDKVRVIRIADFSTELCGGTHTAATGEIGLIKILKEGSVSSGVRRVEAITGEGSLEHFRWDHALEKAARQLVRAKRDEVHVEEGLGGTARRVHEVSVEPLHLALVQEFQTKDAEIKRLARELDQARMKTASSSVAAVYDKIKDVRGVKVLAHRVDNLERPQMRTLVDQLRDKLGSGVVVLGSATNGNVSLIASVTKDLTARIQAGKVIGAVAQKVGGKGGGRPDMAEAGGKDAAALDSALAEVYMVVESLLGT